jgi:hypothetical protein
MKLLYHYGKKLFFTNVFHKLCTWINYQAKKQLNGNNNNKKHSKNSSFQVLKKFSDQKPFMTALSLVPPINVKLVVLMVK